MPYAPTHRLQSELLYQGLRDAGAGIAEGLKRMDSNKNKMENLEFSARLMAAQHPDLVTPEVLEKFSKGGMGQREALVGQMTAAIAEKYKSRQLDQTDRAQQITVAGMNLENERFGRDLAFREKQLDEKVASMIPRFLTSKKNGTEYLHVPLTGLVQPTGKKPISPPDYNGAPAWEIPVYDGETTEIVGPDKQVTRKHSGTIVAKRVWDPIAGKYETIDVRPKANGSDPFQEKPSGNGTVTPPNQAPDNSTGASTAYRSASDVKNAYLSGRLSKEQAAKILREQFGHD